jgi:hypothetical protein
VSRFSRSEHLESMKNIIWLASVIFVALAPAACSSKDSLLKVRDGGGNGGGGIAGESGTTGAGGTNVTDDAAAMPGSGGIPGSGGTTVATGGSGAGGTGFATGGAGGTATGSPGTGGSAAGGSGADGCDCLGGPTTNTGGSAADGGATDGGGGAGDGGKDVAQPPSDLAPDLAPVSSCVGKADFVPCVLVTAPDRKYDICVGGVCVSPGCGDTTCNVAGPHFPLADTGQRVCSDEKTGAIECPAPGAALYGQDAQYGWDTSHASSEHFTRDLSVADEPLVVDNVTGLAWQGCEAGLRGSDCTNGSVGAYSWQDAVAYCDGLSWAGYRDWHLPDLHELDSIATTGSTLDSTAFPATHLSGTFYWSSATSASKSSFAWMLSGSTFDKTYQEPVRCVRGGVVLQGPRFTRDTSVDLEPVVVDNVTGLTWQGCMVGITGRNCDTGTAYRRYWPDWLTSCEGLSWAGKGDWRLPNWKELRSIADPRQTNPAIDAAAFPSTVYNYVFWSSTVGDCIVSSINPSDRNCLASAVDFGSGSESASSNVVSPGYGRCVRGGL